MTGYPKSTYSDEYEISYSVILDLYTLIHEYGPLKQILEHSWG